MARKKSGIKVRPRQLAFDFSPPIEDLLAIFAANVVAGDPAPPEIACRDNGRVLDLFGGLDVVTPAIVHGWLTAPWEFRAGETRCLVAENIGKILGRGIALGIVAAEPMSTWRLLDREIQYRRIGSEWVRIRGLPPADQAAMDRRLATLSKREATRRLNHAEKIAPRIAECLASFDAEVAIPERWHGFLPPGFVERWPTIQAARTPLSELHRDWPPSRQSSWLEAIREEAAKVSLPRRETDERIVAPAENDPAGKAGISAQAELYVKSL